MKIFNVNSRVEPTFLMWQCNVSNCGTKLSLALKSIYLPLIFSFNRQCDMCKLGYFIYKTPKYQIVKPQVTLR